MDEPGEELEPLFDYSRVQPTEFHDLEEDLDSSPVVAHRNKRKRNPDPRERKDERKGGVVVVLDDDEDDKNGKEDEEDWLPPPPKVTNLGSRIEEDDIIRELRLKKQELASLAQSAEDVLRSVMESARRCISNSEEPTPESNPLLESKMEQSSKQVVREKIIIAIQDKDGQKQFRMYMDDKFERLFKMYADKAKVPIDKLFFSFDGDKVSPTSSPQGLGLENDDMLEVHIKP